MFDQRSITWINFHPFSEILAERKPTLIGPWIKWTQEFYELLECSFCFFFSVFFFKKFFFVHMCFQKSVTRSVAESSGLSPQSQLPFNNEAYMWSRYNQQADREWKKYLDKNTSVIVDTFQGQFKSTVSKTKSFAFKIMCYFMVIKFIKYFNPPDKDYYQCVNPIYFWKIQNIINMKW